MEEIWKDITGYEGSYEVSNFGNVRSWILPRGGRRVEPLVLKPVVIGHKPKNLYFAVNLSLNKKQKQFSVHRLVAKHFIPNPLDLPLINHRDEHTFNNHVGNLEWCTVQYNQEYSLSKQVYKFIDPNGIIVEIKNLRKFARENKMNHAHMYQVHLGKLRSYRKWTKFNEMGVV